MHIEEIILDGFKSYATRTVVGKFDPKFNAITGLNGSGKSNILDSICFVLGISMDKVRAGNIQDLIYKKGQAGITKASVTIIFNNKDTTTSPPKFEDCPVISVTRQIINGGKNKYLVNGKASSQQEVVNMFHSVQLNVNNPNFLIQQGKITHVLNMKSNQILGMVEEAAGTRLYEDRKEKAIKVMEKKDLKLSQSAMLLETEIAPKLDELRDKKRSFLEFQKITSEMEQLEQVMTAYQYVEMKEQVDKVDSKKANASSRILHLEQTQDYTSAEIIDIESRVVEVTEDRSKDGGAFFELEEQVKVIGKDVAKFKTQYGLKLAALKEEEESLKSLRENLEESEKAKLETEKRAADLFEKCNERVVEYQEKLEFVSDTETLIQTLTTGMGSSEGKENGYMDQLKNAKVLVSVTTSEIRQHKFKLTHLIKELKTEEPKAKKAGKENAALKAELDSKKNIISMIKEELESMTFDIAQEAPLMKRKAVLESQIKEVISQINDIERSSHGLLFEYSDPVPKFDRSKVKGLVATLISIPKEHYNKATALEVCAGGKLYQVVVESQEVASQLIQKGQLRRRVTIIPLNKINSFVVQAERIAAAKKLAPDGVDLALTLVGSDKEVAKAMNYVFGSTLICKNDSIAKLVTFHKSVNLKSVTFDGDVYDPSGTLSGGAKSQSSGFLLTVQKLKGLKVHLLELRKELHDADAAWNDFEMSKQLHLNRTRDLEIRTHELELHEKRMENHSGFKTIQLVDNLIQEHKITKDLLESSKIKLENAILKVSDIEQEVKELSSDRESKVESLKQKVKEEKKILESLEPTVSKMRQDIMLSQEQVEQEKKEIAKIMAMISTAESGIKESQKDDKALKMELEEFEGKFRFASDRLNDEKKSLIRYDKELQTLEKALSSKKQAIEENKLAIQQLKIELNTFTSDYEQALKQINRLENGNPWIKEQKKHFGAEGSIYDFSKLDISDMSKRIKILKSRHETLGRSIDTSVLELFDRVEKKEIALKQKLSVVQKDKSSIKSTLAYLDRKKLDQLEKTYRKVNEDFGAIFGDLLPGNICKLEPAPGTDITEGLEIKVCLGGVWKSSLTELSGGQRSLIALSLILALLQFNPAPMYILDEVDAALDLSHTQNIGKLLKTRFRTSQFILVSLKDGMFNNANVLFRTKFVDGVSQVFRQEQKQKT